MWTSLARAGILVILGSGAWAQDAGRMRVAVRAERGYLAVDEAHTTLTATGFRQDQQEIRRTLVRDVNAALIRIGRLCNQALQLDPEAPCPEDTRPIRRLTTADWHSLR